jgi:hypothetical protein
MQRVIVTVKRQGEAQVRDLEVPAEIDSESLSKMIAEALRWESDPSGQPIEYEIMAEPPGRVLAPQESLAEAGAWDGAWLVFQPISEEPPPPPSPRSDTPSPPIDGPVIGWRPLDIDLPTEGEQSERGETPSEVTEFVWKQLD